MKKKKELILGVSLIVIIIAMAIVLVIINKDDKNIQIKSNIIEYLISLMFIIITISNSLALITTITEDKNGIPKVNLANWISRYQYNEIIANKENSSEKIKKHIKNEPYSRQNIMYKLLSDSIIQNNNKTDLEFLTKTLKKVFEEVSKVISLFLTFVINKFAPYAIFCLLTRTFAIYGIDSLKPALAYVVTVIIALFVYLFCAYPIYLATMARVNPKPFMKKAAKVALFGFSTSSSAATLPLNKKTTTEELGVSDQIASFVLPLGMTINMDGTAIMQVIAAMFVAVSSGYKVTFMSMAIIAVLALIASIGTPAAPGAGAVILFTILTGMGYTNDAALLAYSLILAINRPIEMLVTSLNVVGDASTSVIVAKKENMLDEEIYHR